MSAFWLKIIALVAMIIDHMGAAFPETFGFGFRVIGRVAFPIFVFLIAEGFYHVLKADDKTRVWKFLARLFVFAIISEPFYDVVINHAAISEINFFNDTNIFYTLFLGGAAIVAYEKIRKWQEKSHIWIFIPVAFVLLLLAEFLSVDYGAYGVVFIFVMYVLRHWDKKFLLMALLCLWQHEFMIRALFTYGTDAYPSIVWALIPATLVPVVLVAFYNGKRGLDLKRFFYTAYPLHLAIIAAVMLL